MNLRDIIDKDRKDQGLGDTVKRVVEKVGVKQSKQKDCGCKKRQEALNRLLPYRTKK